MASPWPLGLVQNANQDEGLSPLAAVVQGCRTATSALQRLAHVEAARSAAENASYEECAELLLPLLEALLDDADGEVQLVTLRELRGIGELLRSKDPGRSFRDLRDLLPVVASLALADSEAIAPAAITTFGALAALLPQDAAAAETQSAIAQLEAMASEDAPVQAARLFAHSAAAWPRQLLASRAPELLRRWCGHRDFAVREAAACCMSLVGRALPPDAWSAALLPWLSQLVRDNNWRVRRAAALDLPRLAGKLHCWQQRCMSRGDGGSTGGGGAACCCAAKAGGGGEGGCFVCDATESCCGACSGDGGTIGAAAAWCRCGDGGIAQLPADLPFGGCAHLGKGEPRGGRDDRHSRHHQGRRTRAAAAAESRLVSASVPASVWSVHAQRPAAAAALGPAGSMGKHPLSSSLLLDPPAGPLGFPDPSPSPTASSSSLSSSDGAHPLGDSLQAAMQPGAGDGCGGVNDSDGFGQAQSPKADSAEQQQQQQEEEAPQQERQQQQQQQVQEQDKGKGGSACALAEADAVLHGCWASLRDCLDCATADGSHWVRVTALSGLGPCLLALPACQISGDLLARFAAMGSSSTVVYGISVALACAQSLGPVSSRLGPRRWPDIRPAFLSLQATREPAVLQELIASLPLLARHLGEPALQLDILPALLTAAHDHLNWVDAAVVAVAPSLAEALPPAAGEPLLRLLSRVSTAGAGDAENCRTWRLRRDVAERLGRLAGTARQEAIMDVLWPVAVTLCSDPVAAVRDAAAAQVGPLLSALLPLVTKEQQCATVAVVAAVGSPSKALPGSGSPDSSGDARQQDQGAWTGQGLGADGSSGDKQQQLALQNTESQVSCGFAGCSGCENGGCACSGGSGEGSSGSADCCTAMGGAVTSDGDDEADSRPSAPPAYEYDTPSRQPHFAYSPAGTAAGAGGYGSSCGGSEGFDDDALFCVLPCALAAPPCDGLSATACSALRPFADALPAAQPPAAAGPVASSPEPAPDPGSQLPPSCPLPKAPAAAPGTGGWSSSESESDSDAESGGAATTAVPAALGFRTPPRSPLRPGAAGAGGRGAARDTSLRLGSSMHPAMAPVGSWGAPPPPRAAAARHGRCASTGELSAAALKTPPRGSVRRHASAGRLGGSPAPSAGRLDPLAPRLSPGLYVDCLIQRFAQSPSWQGRQLFVTIGLGLLASPPLPRRKQEMVLSALAELAADKVVSVRIAAQAAAAALLAAAAEREGGRLQQTAVVSGGGASSLYANGSSRRDSGSSDGDGAPVADCAQLPCPGAAAPTGGVPNGQQHLAAAARVLASSLTDRFEAAAAALCGAQQAVHVKCTAPLPIDV